MNCSMTLHKETEKTEIENLLENILNSENSGQSFIYLDNLDQPKK